MDEIKKVAADLPALRMSASGEPGVDHKAIIFLALPLVANSAIQAILNVTDTWFVGRLSTEATAAMSAISWPALLFILLLGGVGMGVQTLAAQAFGAGKKSLAAHYAWLGMLGALIVTPAFLGIAWLGKYLFLPFALPENVLSLGIEWWQPRLGAGALSVIFGSLTGFFNATNRTKVTFFLTVLLALANIPGNYIFMFYFDQGMAGAAWGTNAALLLASVVGFVIFLSASYRQEFQTHTVWKPERDELKKIMLTGLGIGLMIAIELLGVALFQLMQVKLGIQEGAATQIVMSLTSLGYFPAIGIALAGTTLVGQSIGAGSKQWAFKMGNVVIVYILIYMAFISLVFIGFAEPLSRSFMKPNDPQALPVALIVQQLLWFAAAYQIFDGLNMGSSFCLRGSGDIAVPARLVTGASLVFFVPLCHMLTFNHQQAWVKGLPQLGWGVVGGWIALALYVTLLGSILYWRWLSKRWYRPALV